MRLASRTVPAEIKVLNGDKPMNLKTSRWGCLVVAASLLAACASFEPGMRLQSLNGPRQPSARDTQEGFEVTAEEFVSYEKSNMMFDTDLASSRVLAIFVRTQNNGAEKFSLLRSNIRATLNGQPLSQLPPKEAASQAANSEYVGKALGWTLATGPFAIILWPLTIGFSAVHTHSVNEKIEAYFQGTGYQDSLVAPKQNAFGFVYFNLESKQDMIQNLVVEADGLSDPSGKKFSYQLPIPPVRVGKP
jgi:hypothetical protein